MRSQAEIIDQANQLAALARDSKKQEVKLAASAARLALTWLLDDTVPPPAVEIRRAS